LAIAIRNQNSQGKRLENHAQSFDLFYSFVSQQCFGFHCPLFLKMMAYMHDILGSICFLEKPD